MSTSLPSTDELLRKQSLLQLQINRLLEITQAINNNFSKTDLFKLYQTTLTWEMRIPKFVLFSRNEEDHGWECTAFAGVPEALLTTHPIERIRDIERTMKLEIDDHPLLREFSLVVPVHHKEYAIAFVLLGGDGLDDRDDLYDTIRFISTITNIIAVAIENKRLFKRQVEQEKLKRELELAVQVQNMLIPQNLPPNERFEIAGIYQPHKGVGGDYYDYWELENDEIAFCIADISGKGIAAALLMSNFQASLQSLLPRSGMHVRDFTEQLNQRVLKTTKGEKFITFFMARYNYTHRRLLYINAGHNPPLLYHKGEIQRLTKGCTVLGAFKKLPSFEYGCHYLEDDAFFLLYTDGLTDLRNDHQQFFDDTALEQFVRTQSHLPVRDFNDALLQRANDFRQTQEFPDDISFLSARIFVKNNGKAR